MAADHDTTLLEPKFYPTWRNDLETERDRPRKVGALFVYDSDVYVIRILKYVRGIRFSDNVQRLPFYAAPEIKRLNPI